MIRMVDSFHVMVKPRGAVCNLGCDYCYFLEKEQLYPGSDFRMSDEVLEAFTRQYVQSQPGERVTFAWQGGEPTLMGLPFFERAIALQQKYARPGQIIENTLQTNGTLLDDAWCSFLSARHFLVGVSLDGPAHIHNLYRKNKAGKPTFNLVMAGIQRLKQHQVNFNILAAVHAGSSCRPLEVYRFFRDELDAQYIQFIPIVERAPDGGVIHRSVSPQEYGSFLIAIFDEWVQHDIGKVFVQMFDEALGKWLGAPGGLCVFSETCGLALALEHNGDVYACDHYVAPAYCLGNLLKDPLADLVFGKSQQKFGYAKHAALPATCLACPVRFACQGGCPKDRFCLAPDGEPGLNYLCEGYRAFFTHIDAPMQLMAHLIRAGRSPAGVMGAWQPPGPADEQVL